VAVEVAQEEEEEEEEIGSSEVGSSGNVSLSEKIVLVLLAVEAGVIKEGSGFLPSRWVLSRAITACAIKAGGVRWTLSFLTGLHTISRLR
jgi:hypothetical protein